MWIRCSPTKSARLNGRGCDMDIKQRLSDLKAACARARVYSSLLDPIPVFDVATAALEEIERMERCIHQAQRLQHRAALELEGALTHRDFVNPTRPSPAQEDV